MKQKLVWVASSSWNVTFVGRDSKVEAYKKQLEPQAELIRLRLLLKDMYDSKHRTATQRREPAQAVC